MKLLRTTLLASVAAIMATSAHAAGPEASVVGAKCVMTSAGPKLEGEIKNVAWDRLESVEVFVTFRDQNGEFISKGSGHADFKPLLPDQVSSFTVWGDTNPVIAKATIVLTEGRKRTPLPPLGITNVPCAR